MAEQKGAFQTLQEGLGEIGRKVLGSQQNKSPQEPTDYIEGKSRPGHLGRNEILLTPIKPKPQPLEGIRDKIEETK